MKKVLVLYNRLFHYRIPIWNILADQYDLTVAYCQEDKFNDEVKFKKLPLHAKAYGRFTFQKENIYKLCQQYDAVLAYGDIAWLKYSTLPWHKKRKFKIAYWGIGVSASYGKHFDAVTKWDKIRDWFYRKADAHVFYSDYPIKKYVDNGFKREMLFVAPNTVAVEPIDVNTERTRLLFVGTLYREKGIQFLLSAYLDAYKENSNIPVLDIVGGGPDAEMVKQWIIDNGLQDNIIMHGAIYDRKEKAKYFSRSIACISPQQAGLTVLESMGYGTTFITTVNAITGGEVFNVENGVTGVLVKDVADLKDVLIDIANNRDKYLQIGKQAYKHYWDCRKPEDMAKGLADTVEYMLNQK